MKTEEKLNEIFALLRKETPQTDAAQVQAWLNAAGAHKKKHTNLNKLFKPPHPFLMTSIALVILTGYMTFFSGSFFQKTKSAKKNPSPTQEKIPAAIFSMTGSTNENPPEITQGISHPGQKMSKNLFHRQTRPISVTEASALSNENLSGQAMHNNPVWTYGTGIERNNRNGDPVSSPGNSPAGNSGTWTAKDNLLQVDTAFRHIKKLVFTGNAASDVKINGNSSEKLSLHCNYKMVRKGLFIDLGKKSVTTLSYEIKDSVLYVNFHRSGSFTIAGAAYTSSRSDILFDVPENIDLEVNNSYGDLEINQVKGKTHKIDVEYGDVSMKNLKGSIVLNSNYGDLTASHLIGGAVFTCRYGDVKANHLEGGRYKLETTFGEIDLSQTMGNLVLNTNHGDVTLHQVEGDISAKVGYGDVKGTEMLVTGQLDVSCSNGNVDCELRQPSDDLNLDLKSSYGEVIVKRTDIQNDGGKLLRMGKGSHKVNITSVYGDVTIR